MAGRRSNKKTLQIEEFAEDLGTLLGSATAKAESWLGQRQQIVKRLTEVRDTASKLLADLGQQAQAAVAAGTKAYRRRRGRPAGSKNKKAGIIFVGGRTGKTISTAATTVVNKIRGIAPEPVVRKRRKMSAKGRAAISAAQKARWSKQNADKKKAK